MPKSSKTRKDFIRKFMDAGLDYVDAVRAFEAMTEVFAQAVCAGEKVCVGRVLAITPTVVEPRVVNMRFARTKSGVISKHRQFFLGRRLRYRVNIYREFTAKHRIHV